jgi:hypothetical protein
MKEKERSWGGEGLGDKRRWSVKVFSVDTQEWIC